MNDQTPRDPQPVAAADTQSTAIRPPPAAEKRRAAAQRGNGAGAPRIPFRRRAQCAAPRGALQAVGAAGPGAPPGGRGRGRGAARSRGCDSGAVPGRQQSRQRHRSARRRRQPEAGGEQRAGAGARRAGGQSRGGGGGGPGAAGADAERSRAGGGGGSGHGGAPLKEAAREEEEEEEERGGEEKSPHSLPPRPVPSADRLPRACPAEAAAEDFGIRRGPAVLPRPFSAANKGGEREEGRAHLRGASMADRSLESVSLPLEVRARLAELELELSEGKGAAPRVRPVPARRRAVGGSGGFVPPGGTAAEVGAGAGGVRAAVRGRSRKMEKASGRCASCRERAASPGCAVGGGAGSCAAARGAGIESARRARRACVGCNETLRDKVIFKRNVGKNRDYIYIYHNILAFISGTARGGGSRCGLLGPQPPARPRVQPPSAAPSRGCSAL